MAPELQIVICIELFAFRILLQLDECNSNKRDLQTEPIKLSKAADPQYSNV